MPHEISFSKATGDAAVVLHLHYFFILIFNTGRLLKHGTNMSVPHHQWYKYDICGISRHLSVWSMPLLCHLFCGTQQMVCHRCVNFPCIKTSLFTWQREKKKQPQSFAFFPHPVEHRGSCGISLFGPV